MLGIQMSQPTQLRDSEKFQAIARVVDDARIALEEFESFYRQIEPALIRQTLHRVRGLPAPDISEALHQYQHASKQPFHLEKDRVSRSEPCAESAPQSDTSC